MSAINKQVDGNHYNKLKIQPIQLGYALGASPCFVKLAKYITRDKDNKLIQLQKAVHVVELEAELLQGDEAYFHFINHDEGGECEEVLYTYAEKRIFAFAAQFDNQLIIADVLLDMFLGNHKEAVKSVNELAETLMVVKQS